MITMTINDDVIINDDIQLMINDDDININVTSKKNKKKTQSK